MRIINIAIAAYDGDEDDDVFSDHTDVSGGGRSDYAKYFPSLHDNLSLVMMLIMMVMIIIMIMIMTIMMMMLMMVMIIIMTMIMQGIYSPSRTTSYS